MKSPMLSRQLVLEAPQDVSDGAGGFDRIWMPLGTHWAEVRFGSGRKLARGDASLSRAAVRIVLRAAPEGSAARPKPGQRLREGARLYAIESVNEADASGRYLMCRAVEERVA